MTLGVHRSTSSTVARDPIAGRSRFGSQLSPERPWRRTAPWHVAALIATDSLVALVAATAMSQVLFSAVESLALGLLACVVFPLATWLCGGYRVRHMAVGNGELRTMARVVGLLSVLALVLQGLSIVALPAVLVLQVVVLTACLSGLARLAQRAIIRRLRGEGRLSRRTLLVGPSHSLRPVFDALQHDQVHGMSIVGVCTPENDDADGPTGGPVIGTYASVPEIAANLDVDSVVVAADAMGPAELRRLGWSMRDLPVTLFVLPPLTDVAPHRLRMEPMADTPLLAVSFTESPYQQLVKATVDRVAGSALLLLALPIILTAGVVVRVTSRGPAFFAQTRVGCNGELFTMHKLRSMYEDAEERLAELESHSDGNGMLFKMRDDPRVTPVGKILRRLSIDELPQLWNVVRGDMSLVGPRPALPREVAAYEGDIHHRLRVKPGLTGLWQVSGRSNLSAERSVRLDLSYTDNWTVATDLKILLKTARAVLRSDGAY